MKKKILSMILVIAMVLLLIPANALAADATISTNGDYDLAAHGHGNGDTIAIASGCRVRLIGSTATTYTNFQIICGTGADLTIENVNIDDSANMGICPLAFIDSGNKLTLSGTNTLKGGFNKPAVRVEGTTALEITGSGSVVATGDYYSAGIGGGYGASGGTIKISGGTVKATGGYYGAGIGGGAGGNGGTIQISGGNIVSKGGENSAGIGGGAEGGSGGVIAISGGDIVSIGGYNSAGIGGGYGGSGGNISIEGGIVRAAGNNAHDVGDGQTGSGGTLSISGAAAVLLRNDSSIEPTASTHTHESITGATGSNVFGVPCAWTGDFGAYLRLNTLSYDANGGSSTAPASITQHTGTTCSVSAGSTLSRSNYTPVGWNTAADGSGTAYAFDSIITFSADTTLYAQWQLDGPITQNGTYVLTSGSSGNTLAIDTGLTVTLQGDGSTLTNFQISCGDGVDLTIENVRIDDRANDGKCPLVFTGRGNTLTLSGTNTVKSSETQSAVSVETWTALEITGIGTLEALGGNSAAGIGGGYGASGGTIQISGGTVEATGSGGGAGIGGGYGASGGTIQISGGTVEATGDGGGAGIGGGAEGGNGGVIDISGGDIVSMGDGGGAGIGGGSMGSGGVIAIYGGDIISTGGEYGAGIGGGFGDSGGDIAISGGDIVSTGGENGAGIGGGSDGSGGVIVISGGDIVSTGGGSGAGIGGGQNESCGNIFIQGGIVRAAGNIAHDVGNGYRGSGGTLSISGTAALLLRNDRCIIPTISKHTHESIKGATGSSVFGVSCEWTGDFGAYLRLNTLSYNANGGSGTAPASITQHTGTTCNVSAGSGLTRTGYDFAGWNTSAGGSGTAYAPDSTFVFSANTTLYSVWTRSKYTVTVVPNNASYGSVTGGGNFTGDVSVKVTATPKSGYHFVRWTENGSEVSTDAEYSFTAMTDRTLQAEFAINSYTISVSANDAAYGTVSGSGVYDFGSNATVSATPKSGYRFLHWTAGGTTVSTHSSYTFTISSDVSLTAEFVPLTPVGINCSKTDNSVYDGASGSITVSASGGDSGTYEYSINEVSWQSSNVFGGLPAATYTATVRDAAYPGNSASCTVDIGQPSNMGSIPAKKIPSKVNTGISVTVVPPAAPKGYTTTSISYTSSNPAIATVDVSGNVTFLAGGKVTIMTTITSQMTDSKGHVKTKTTTVKKTITVQQPVSAISLSQSNTNIARTQKVKLTASIAPSTASIKKLTWKSSNPKVASVSSSGVVIGKTGGTAVITCTAKDGSGISASCTVTVTPIYPTSVTFKKAALSVKLGKTASLKANIAPKNTDFKTVTWASSNPAVVSVDGQGKVKALASGTAVITATTSNGISASCMVTVS